MKSYILLISLQVSFLALSACATTPEPIAPQAPVAAPEPVATTPAPAAVDCTGLSEAQCQYQIENYGNPNPAPMRGPLDIDPVPVEPVEVEPMGDVRG